MINNRVTEKEMLLQADVINRLKSKLQDRELSYIIISYGCQMNDNDSQKLAGMLEAVGYHKAAAQSDADLILFNTCCVREHAELKVFGNIGALKALKDNKPELIIAVGGCMMQQEETSKKLFKRFPFVDIVFGTHNIHEFPSLLEHAIIEGRILDVQQSEGRIAEGLPSLITEGVSASVTIMYGCNNYCSYCIVPYVRGRERSRGMSDIENEVSGLVRVGFSEIMLLGQNVNSYLSEHGEPAFPDLLERLNSIEGLRRIRFMTSHPKDLSDRLIEAMAGCDKVCKHIHLPVQSGSNRILEKMNRKYTREKYLELIQKIRANVADIELTTDVIVGFPGETDKDFSDTLDLINKVGFAAAYTFMYSPRTGTKAASMPDQVDPRIKKQRLLELNKAQMLQTKLNNEKYIGRILEVLVEGCDTRSEPIAYGKSGNFKMVYFPGLSDIVGQYLTIKVDKTKNNSLIGEIVKGV